MKRFIAGLLVGKMVVGGFCYLNYLHHQKEERALLQQLTTEALQADRHYDDLEKRLGFTVKFGCQEQMVGKMQESASHYREARAGFYQTLQEVVRKQRQEDLIVMQNYAMQLMENLE
ncbi:hypothetical protein HYS48_05270 [Candidatus Woesearchaeota archaeon]|nr:hypothetical protein [Candidatus Woesearchaeota archaeon]